ncbi:glycosyltransferase family 2 protein [Streptomyces sp. ISL-22]|uniref:glycosyltransferase family 2 protein n=1 Tax=unclassified Streptomyces TaxID=2593676 RepID=UPI001BE62430|nr:MULTISPECIES: glycosyltransferase family 2 protein [unclassified Streptomyces]MBT2419903.1 glycosyltransferase family 2 protein [Streptomyces sp. ISL-24]MBT2431688.1 glycosyltransferase family 2 protein [Streptomyces sp. ISL-22]
MTVTQPDVTVIIGAYEAMPYLVECLASVEAQTIDPERIEVIAVDDGSTDGTGECLEEFAARAPMPVTVIRQENSGGPSGPRNVGLGKAAGRYVFFLDADDRLGPEALERMVAMADKNGTDVVLGRVEGVNRTAPKSMWGRTLERTDVFSSNIKFTLSAQKLFRRELLTRHNMRFDESLWTGEDALFTMEAYLRADGVSVIADYTCYYLVGRDDGKHVTKSGGYTLRFDSARALMNLISELVPAGERRDLLMVRPFLITLLPQFGPKYAKDSEKVRQHKLELAKPLMDAHWTPGVARRLKVEERLRLHLVAEQRPELLLPVVQFIKAKKQPAALLEKKGRRVYLAYPHFRDAAAGIPDSVYLAEPREARAFPGYREGGVDSFLRRAVRKARRVLRSGGATPGGRAAAA